MARKTLADVTGGKVEIPDVFPRRDGAPPDRGPETPAEAPAPEPEPAAGPAPGSGRETPRRPARKAPARRAPEPDGPDPEPDAAMLGRWRWTLGATARKAAAAEARANATLAEWERLVADAAAAGVPARLVVAAAADAGLDTPEPA